MTDKAKIICFASAKGGSGKTVTAATFAECLTALGKAVLLIDVDAATNGMTLLYIDEVLERKRAQSDDDEPARGLFDALSSGAYTTCRIGERTELLPATYTMKQTEDIGRATFGESLTSAIAQFGGSFDYIFVDAQAGTDMYARHAIERADEIVIVTEYDPISVQGAERLRHLFHDVLPRDAVWVLFNKVLPEFAKAVGDYLGVVRYLPPIPWDADVVRAFVQRELAIDMEKGNPFTLSILRTAKVLFGKTIASSMDDWKEERKDALQEPSRNALKAIDQEIGATEKAIIQTEFDLRSIKTVPKIITGAGGVMASIGAALFLKQGFGPETTDLEILSSYLLLAVGATALALSFLLRVGSYTPHPFSRFSILREKELLEQSRRLNRMLDDLQDKRTKLKATVDAGLDELVKPAIGSTS